MKQFTFVLFLNLVMITGIHAEEKGVTDPKCEKKSNNFFSLDHYLQSGQQKFLGDCQLVENSNRRRRSQSMLSERLDTAGCNFDVKIDFANKEEAKNKCYQVTKCLSKTKAFISEKSSLEANELYCSTKFLNEVQSDALLKNILKDFLAKTTKDDGIDKKLDNLIGFVFTNINPESRKKVHLCKDRIAEGESCFKKIKSIPNEVIKSLKDEIISESKDYDKVKYLNAQIETQNQMRLSSQQTKLPVKTVYLPAGDADNIKHSLDISQTSLFQMYREAKYDPSVVSRVARGQQLMHEYNHSLIPEKHVLKKGGNKKAPFMKSPTPESTLPEGYSDRELRDIEKLLSEQDKILNSFDVDLNSIKSKFSNQLANSKGEELRQNYEDSLIESANAILDKKCGEAILYNEENMCAKLEDEFTNPKSYAEMKDPIENVIEHVSKNKNKYADVAENKVAELNNIASNIKFNYARHLTNLRLQDICYSVIGEEIFKGDTAELNSYMAEKEGTAQALVKSSRSQTAANLKNTANDFSKSDDSRMKALGSQVSENANQYLADTKYVAEDMFRDRSYNHSQGLKNMSEFGVNNQMLDPKSMTANNAPVQPNQTTDTSYLPDSKTMANLAGNNHNNSSQTANYNYQAPILPSNTSLIGTENNDSGSLQKKIDELSKREAELREKSDGKKSDGPSDEMQALQKQIEELRTQLAESKKDALGNKMINAPKVETTPTQSTIGNNTDTKKLSSAISANAPQVTRAEARTNDSNDSNGRFEDRNNQAMNNANAAANAVARAGSAQSTSSPGPQSKSFGIVLTKTGEATEDINKIAENPKEADILVLVEKSNGRPFIIKENGTLVQVQVRMGKDGKPVMVNGRPELIKTKLSKEVQAKIVKDLNIVREAKEARDTVRLRDLNKTTNQALK